MPCPTAISGGSGLWLGAGGARVSSAYRWVGHAPASPVTLRLLTSRTVSSSSTLAESRYQTIERLELHEFAVDPPAFSAHTGRTMMIDGSWRRSAGNPQTS